MPGSNARKTLSRFGAAGLKALFSASWPVCAATTDAVALHEALSMERVAPLEMGRMALLFVPEHEGALADA